MFVFEIDPTLLSVLAGITMAGIQSIKPLIPGNSILLVNGMLSITLGLLLTLVDETASGLPQLAMQTLIYAFVIGSSASGVYSWVPKKEETPRG